jgi:hypothetical protein
MMPWHFSSFESGEVKSSNVGVSGVSKVRIDPSIQIPPKPI